MPQKAGSSSNLQAAHKSERGEKKENSFKIWSGRNIRMSNLDVPTNSKKGVKIETASETNSNMSNLEIKALLQSAAIEAQIQIRSRNAAATKERTVSLPSSTAKESSISAKAPYISTKEPCISAPMETPVPSTIVPIRTSILKMRERTRERETFIRDTGGGGRGGGGRGGGGRGGGGEAAGGGGDGSSGKECVYVYMCMYV